MEDRARELVSMPGRAPEAYEEALQAIIRQYTQEAGVRNLEREVANVCRKIARDVARRLLEAQAERQNPPGSRISGVYCNQ